MNYLLHLLFCRAEKMGFPITPFNRRTGKRAQTYRCCHDCGQEFAYKGPLVAAPAPAPELKEVTE